VEVRSPAFEPNGSIPPSLVLIVDDPDAPDKTWVHWVVYGIPVVSEIDEDSVPGTQGRNDFGRQEYDGPAPPSGTHRYFFKVYALDQEVDWEEGLSKADVEQRMAGHVVDEAELVGTYSH